MHDNRSYADLVLAGEADIEDFDDYLDEWHDGETGMSLKDFMGFNRHEWGLIMADHFSLRIVLAARQRRLDIDEVRRAHDGTFAMAARITDKVDRDQLERWLRRHGIE